MNMTIDSEVSIFISTRLPSEVKKFVKQSAPVSNVFQVRSMHGLETLLTVVLPAVGSLASIIALCMSIKNMDPNQTKIKTIEIKTTNKRGEKIELSASNITEEGIADLVERVKNVN